MASRQNHQLLIMRHAKSDWDADYSDDFNRPLSKRGLRDAEAMAGWLFMNGLVPDKVISSPARRAKQTVSLVMEGTKLVDSLIIWEDRIYDAGLGDLLQVIDSHRKDSKRMLLVGHNPGIDSLVLYLSKNDPKSTPSGKLMTTAAIAVLDFGNGMVSTDDRSATLIELMRPKELPRV